MPSTLPTPMPLEQLRRYRWATPITAQDIPVLSLPASGITDMYVGETTVSHVFADSPDGGVTPAIAQTLWGYGSSPNDIRHPGPTLVAKAYVANQVRWINTLPKRVHHPFVQPPMDARLGGMMGRYSVGHVCVHLHGAHVPWTSDGHPVRRAAMPVPTGSTLLPLGANEAVLRLQSGTTTNDVNFEYPNTQMGGAMLWYHDHTMDMTSMNVYSGLAGGYLLRDLGEAAVTDLPSGDFEMPLIIQDRSFMEVADPDGNWMLYGDAPYLRQRNAEATRLGTTPAEKRAAIRALGAPMGEFKGDAMCVNGKIWPFMKVEPRVYRFRILNGCNTRMLVLRMSKEVAHAAPPHDFSCEPNVLEVAPNIPLVQIGGDDGFITPFVPLSGVLVNGQPSTADFLVLASGERADVLIDFSALGGTNVYLSNHATENSPLGNGGDLANGPNHLQYSVLQFRVAAVAASPPLDSVALAADLMAVLAAELAAKAVPLMPNFAVAHPLPLPTRRYVISEAGVALTATDAATLAATGANPPGRFGWNAITMQPDPSLVGVVAPEPDGLLWAGPPPAPYGGPPAGGPYIEAQDRPASATRHNLEGAVELWEFYNLSVDVHPLHLHLASFQVLSRQNILVAWAPAITAQPEQAATAATDMTPATPAMPATLATPLQPWILASTVLPDGALDPDVLLPDANERGWKDTVRVNAAPPQSDPLVPGEPVGVVTRLLVRFDNGGDVNRDYSGHFVFHCHLLEHEDMGMMRPLEIYQLGNYPP